MGRGHGQQPGEVVQQWGSRVHRGDPSGPGSYRDDEVLYRWCDLVKYLEANIPPYARNTHEYEFLGSIPAEAIVVYIKYESHRLHNLKDAITEMVEDEGKHSVLLVVDSNSGI